MLQPSLHLDAFRAVYAVVETARLSQHPKSHLGLGLLHTSSEPALLESALDAVAGARGAFSLVWLVAGVSFAHALGTEKPTASVLRRSEPMHDFVCAAHLRFEPFHFAVPSSVVHRVEQVRLARVVLVGWRVPAR